MRMKKKKSKKYWAFLRKKDLKKAFKAVKADMTALESGQFELKQSTDDWVKYLMEKNAELAQRIEALEKQMPVKQEGTGRLSALKEC